MTDEKIEEKAAPVELDHRAWLVSDGWETPVSIRDLIRATVTGKVRWTRHFNELYRASWAMDDRVSPATIKIEMPVGPDATSAAGAPILGCRAEVLFVDPPEFDGPYQLQGPGIDQLRILVAHRVHNEAVATLERVLAGPPRGTEGRDG